ncbi:MAG: hypothetical protein U1E65_31765 [Myxococcota bacterium]
MRSGVLVGALLALGSEVAMAQATPSKVERLAVVPTIIEGAAGATDVNATSVRGDVNEAAQFRLGVRLATNEEVGSVEDLAARVRDCGSDHVCIVERFRQVDARYGLVVVVNQAINPAIVSLMLVDADGKRVVGEAVGVVSGAEATVSGAIRARTSKLLAGAGHAEAARVIIDVSPRGTVVLGDGVPADEGTGNIFTIPPGSYHVRASADGYEPGQTDVVAIAGRETRVGLTLEESNPVYTAWWFWSAIGLAVAGGTTAAILATRSTTRCFCIDIAGHGCDLCDK